MREGVVEEVVGGVGIGVMEEEEEEEEEWRVG